jgi:hypothetical protein
VNVFPIVRTKAGAKRRHHPNRIPDCPEKVWAKSGADKLLTRMITKRRSFFIVIDFSAMASSWYPQIPTILTLLRELQPTSVLDVGKGFGKYGLLIQEYFGINETLAPDPQRSLAEQSRIIVDAVESEPHFLWPHILQFYRKVHVGRFEEVYESLEHYQVVLMIDVIEHIEKSKAHALLEYLVSWDSVVVISTPKHFFTQEVFESPDEQHISHWTRNDFHFRTTPCYCVQQQVSGSMLYCLAKRKLSFQTFGRGPLRSLKRIGHAVLDELLRDT